MTVPSITRRLLALFAMALLASSTAAGEGKKPTTYPFALEPEKALAALDRLEKSAGQKRPMSADEKALAKDVQGGRFVEWSMAEAALLADGVADRDARKELLKKYQTIRADAKRAIAGETTPAGKGKRLLETLHARAMKGGYEGNQTHLCKVLETGKFNCVSATVLYNAVATDLGLEVDAVEESASYLPGHVYSRLRSDKKWLVVETTNAKGFGASRGIGSSSRLLTPAGTVAVIWANRSADAIARKSYHEGVALGVLALGIDPSSPPTNGRVALVKWAIGLADQSKFAESQTVLTTALEVDPKNRDLINGREVVYHRWADHLGKSGSKDDTLDLLRRAAREGPSHARSYEAKQTQLFTSEGETLIGKGEWQKAHDSAAPGRTKLTGKPLEGLIDWQKSVHLRWGNRCLAADEFDKAIAAFEKGLSLYPDHRGLEGNRWYAVAKWLEATRKNGGDEKAYDLAVRLKKKYEAKKQLDEALARHVTNVLDTYLTAGKYTEAKAAAKAHADLLTPDAAVEQSRKITLHQADSLAGKKDWAAAHNVFTDALTELPGDKVLAQRGAALWDRQARSYLDRKEWKQAIDLYEQGLKLYPRSSLLTNNRDYCKQAATR